MVLAILARSCTGLKNCLRYARKTVSEPTVMAPARMSEPPRHITKAVQNDTVRPTMGERSDLMRRALSDAATMSRLTSPRRFSSSSWRPKALTARIDSSPCVTTATMSL